MTGINIIATGCYNPALTVTNDDLAKIMETNDEWIRTRTGIAERRMNNGEPTWYMGTMAAKQAIERAGIDVKDIGLIIDATITPDFSTPSTACVIQRELGAVNATAFDISAACSGFVFGVDMARKYLAVDETLKYVIVIANENLSRMLNYEDRTSSILFGDGAAAAVIERADKLYSSWTGSDGTGAKFLYSRYVFPPHPFMTDEPLKIDDGTETDVTNYRLVQDGKEVYKFATKALPTAAVNAAEKIGLDLNEIDMFIPHQANIRIIETAAKNLGIPMEKFFVNIEKHGNTSSASIPIALNDAIESGALKKGDKLCLVGFGAGLTLGAVILEY